MNDKVGHLPPELKSLVRDCVSLLGEVIKEEGGKELYQEVETIRQQMIEYRGFSEEKRQKTLKEILNKLKKQKKKKKHQIAHSFSLMMELINSCEAAYRTYRLKKSHQVQYSARQDNMMVYVLTAHPTEARTPQNIELFRRIQSVAIRILDKSGEEEYMKSIIKHNLKIAWLLPITRHEKPEVVDEANHLFSIILRPDIFDTILRGDRDLGNIRLRTWVGGDKDGHPGVDEKVMLQCLNASRKHFISILGYICRELNTDICYLNQKKLTELTNLFETTLKKLKKISAEDSSHLRALKKTLEKLDTQYQKVVGQQAPRIGKLQSIFKLFPALVIPIELREDSEIILQGLKSKKPIAIERMLIKLKEISKHSNARDYAQGFIISMCHSYEDIQNAQKMVKRALGGIDLPIIPLFETADALESSPQIVAEVLQDKNYLKQVKSKWNNHLEVMLGYSDSSKGMGVLPSRVAIAKTIRTLDFQISNEGVIPVFFHGSGGSVDRGGGSLKEQTAWWPRSALNIYKATIQGEMVERNFTSAEVSISGMNKILENFHAAKSKSGVIQIDTVIEDFSEIVKSFYIQKINDADFFHMIEAATPYSYLSALKLGSRPSKRAKAKKLDLSSIRAIPWILCWTQTRILFPTWWGVGSAWEQFKKDKAKVLSLQESYQTSSLFSSYVRVLGFTLSKVELDIFQIYLSEGQLEKSEEEKIFQEFKVEFKQACEFVKTITQEKDLLWYRPWLYDSIQLRASMINPLNLLQILGQQENDMVLVRKTIAGISSGMMTTG